MIKYTWGVLEQCSEKTARTDRKGLSSESRGREGGNGREVNREGEVGE